MSLSSSEIGDIEVSETFSSLVSMLTDIVLIKSVRLGCRALEVLSGIVKGGKLQVDKATLK